MPIKCIYVDALAAGTYSSGVKAFAELILRYNMYERCSIMETGSMPYRSPHSLSQIRVACRLNLKFF